MMVEPSFQLLGRHTTAAPGWILGLLASLIISSINCAPAVQQCPASWQFDWSELRENKDLLGSRLFWLDVGNASRGYLPDAPHDLIVKSRNYGASISDLLVTSNNTNPECNNGHFVVQPNSHLYQPAHCTSVVSFGKKVSMKRVRLQWVAPSCGCAHIRVIVKSSLDFYYADEDKAERDLLSKVICSRDSLNSSENTKEFQIPKNYSKEEILKNKVETFSQLCQLIEEHNPEEDPWPLNFLESRQMNQPEKDHPKWEILQLILDQRRSGLRQCCQIKDPIIRLECFSDIRRQRIDQLCGDGQPELPFTKLRSSWMAERQEMCCHELGEDRYSCFSKNSIQTTDVGAFNLIILDETDPFNDLNDYINIKTVKASDLSVSGSDRESSTAVLVKEETPRRKAAGRMNRAGSKQIRPGADSSVKSVDRSSADDDVIKTGGKKVQRMRDDLVVDPFGSKRMKDGDCCTEGLRIGFSLPKPVSKESAERLCNIVRSHYQMPSLRKAQTFCSKAFLSCCLKSAVDKFDIHPESADASQKSQINQEQDGNGKMKKTKKLIGKLKKETANDDVRVKNKEKENVKNTEKMLKWYLLKQLLAPSPEPMKSTGRSSQEENDDDDDDDDDEDNKHDDGEEDDEEEDDEEVEEEKKKDVENQRNDNGKKLREEEKEDEEKEDEEEKKDEDREEKRKEGLQKKKGSLRSSMRNRRPSKVRRVEKSSSNKKQRHRHLHGKRKKKSKRKH